MVFNPTPEGHPKVGKVIVGGIEHRTVEVLTAALRAAPTARVERRTDRANMIIRGRSSDV